MTIKEVSEKYSISQDTLRYYERIGMIPPVTRTGGGIRSYSSEDLVWVELVVCMRKAGLSIEVLTKYVKLYQQGDETFAERLELLKGQKEALVSQRQQIDDTINRLDYKISRYEQAVKTGRLVWDKED